MLPFNVTSHLCCYFGVFVFFRVLGGLAHHKSIRFAPALCTRRPVVLGCALGSDQKLGGVFNRIDLHCVLEKKSLGNAFDLHGPTFTPCSEPPTSLDSCNLVRFRDATFSPKITSTSPAVSFIFSTACCFNDLIACLEFFRSGHHRVFLLTSSLDNSCCHPSVAVHFVSSYKKNTFANYITFD